MERRQQDLELCCGTDLERCMGAMQGRREYKTMCSCFKSFAEMDIKDKGSETKAALAKVISKLTKPDVTALLRIPFTDFENILANLEELAQAKEAPNVEGDVPDCNIPFFVPAVKLLRLALLIDGITKKDLKEFHQDSGNKLNGLYVHMKESLLQLTWQCRNVLQDVKRSFGGRGAAIPRQNGEDD